jgi:hypothetical protein
MAPLDLEIKSDTTDTSDELAGADYKVMEQAVE